MIRGPVIAAMLMTWEKNQRDATRFWSAVRDETGESPDQPDRRLARWLNATCMARGLGTHQVQGRKADAREFYVKCVRSWNAFRKGIQDTLRYVADAELPKVV